MLFSLRGKSSTVRLVSERVVEAHVPNFYPVRTEKRVQGSSRRSLVYVGLLGLVSSQAGSGFIVLVCFRGATVSERLRKALFPKVIGLLPKVVLVFGSYRIDLIGGSVSMSLVSYFVS